MTCGGWLGGRRKAEGQGWEWLDGRLWIYQNWGYGQPDNYTGNDCMGIEEDGTWVAGPCILEFPFICGIPVTMTGSRKMVFRNTFDVQRNKSSI